MPCLFDCVRTLELRQCRLILLDARWQSPPRPAPQAHGPFCPWFVGEMLARNARWQSPPQKLVGTIMEHCAGAEKLALIFPLPTLWPTLSCQTAQLRQKTALIISIVLKNATSWGYEPIFIIYISREHRRRRNQDWAAQHERARVQHFSAVKRSMWFGTTHDPSYSRYRQRCLQLYMPYHIMSHRW